MVYFIKDLGIILCYIYCFIKFSNAVMTKRKILLSLFLAIVISMVVVVPDSYNTFITIPLMYVLVTMLLLFILERLDNNFWVMTLISFDISYVFFAISAFITTILAYLFWLDEYYVINQIIVFCIQVLLLRLLFCIKRIKRISLLLNQFDYLILGVIISFCIFTSAIFLNKKMEDYSYVLKYFCFEIFSILIFVYWRASINKTYLEKLNLRNNKSLNIELQQKDEYIKKLEADNKRLSKIVHRDNKLVPAMERAVERYLMEASEPIVPAMDELSTVNGRVDTGRNLADGNMNEIKASDDIYKRGTELLDELRKMASEREGLLDTAISKENKLPTVGIMRVDDLLDYMQQKASDKGISLHVTIDCEIREAFDKYIDEASFCTLLADMIDNAIIATRYNNGGNILIDFSMVKKVIAFNIFDSGIPFTKEVLFKYGNEQYTTHADDNGSGIGLMQTAEILDKCGASLFIDEFPQDEGLYTKKISVVFNRKHQYVLYTSRNDDDIAYLKKRGDLIVVRK